MPITDPTVVLDTSQKLLTRRGFQVVVEDSRLRFIGGTDEAVAEITASVESIEDDEPPLSALLHDMGLDVDVDGKYLVAFPAI